jgi:protein MpaA
VAIRRYDDLVKRLRKIAALPNIELVHIGDFESGGRAYPMFYLLLGSPGPGKKNVMIDAGIHGDEPGGVEAALRFLEQNAGNETLLGCFAFTVFPCNNPTGWELNTRENADGIDLNRQFNVRKPAPEAAIISQALQGKCFDLLFEMHEDVDSPGFYMYEIADDPSTYLGEKIIEAVEAAGCPINRNECVEGMPADGGLIRRKTIRFRKTRLPLAIHAHRTCGGHVLTLEPPASMLSLEERVRIELIGLTIALDAVSSAG